MTKTSEPSPSNRLPITRSLTLACIISLIIALIMTVASIVGIFFRDIIYPSVEQSESFVPNDILNLGLGLPILLGSIWLARRGNLIGLLCWPGALFYVLYNYTAYLLGIPFNELFLLYLFLVMLSAYTIIAMVASIDEAAVRHQLSGRVPIRTAGGILLGITLGVFIYQIVAIVTALINQNPVDRMELAQWIDDLVVVSPPLFITGFLMLQRKALGYVAAMGLLLLCSMLFIGLVPVMVIQALLKNAPVDVIGILVVLVSGMICFIPLSLFIRGAAKCEK